MKRRIFLKQAGAVGAAVAFGSGAPEAVEDDRRQPNLVYVFPDQYRRQAMGFVGQDPVLTPRIDGFAKDSLYLPHAVSNYPVCSPHRAILMTSQHPVRNGVLANCHSGRTHLHNYLKEEARCMTDVLSEAGYSTGYIGKWHLDGPDSTSPGEPVEWDAFTPPGKRRHSVDFWYAYGTYNDHLHPHYWTGDADERDRLEISQWSPQHEADQAILFIRNDGGNYREGTAPFALFVSMNPPHPPYNLVPDKYRDLYGGRTNEDLLVRSNVDLGSVNSERARRSVSDYFAMVSGVDEQFGRILDALEGEGLADDTIVVFTSDHGEMMGSHGRMSKNVIYEESMNIPFLIRYPRTIDPREDDLMLSTQDIFPSLMGLMQLADRTPESVEGVDRSSVMVSGTGERPDSALYMRLPAGKPGEGMRGLRTHGHTYQAAGERDQTALLFDNAADPFQMVNLAGMGQRIEAQLRERMEEQLVETRDPWVAV